MKFQKNIDFKINYNYYLTNFKFSKNNYGNRNHRRKL